MCFNDKPHESVINKKVAIVVDSVVAARWVCGLADQLALQPGYQVSWYFDEMRNPGGKWYLSLAALEELIWKRPTPLLQVPGDIRGLSLLDPDTELVINLTSRKIQLKGVDTISVTFNGDFSLGYALEGIWSDQPLEIQIFCDSKGDWRPTLKAFIAVPDKELIVRAMDAIWRRLIELLIEFVDLSEARRSAMRVDGSTDFRSYEARKLTSLTSQALRSISRQSVHGYFPKALRSITRLAVRDRDWCIGIRKRKHQPDLKQLDLSPETFSVIPCPRDRYYADPFLFSVREETFLFFEEFDYRTKRAHISWTKLDREGVPSSVAVALRRPYHLSYPFVFEWNGSVYMLPETAGNRTVELYVADGFPAEWRLHSTLLSDIDACDATLHMSPDGKWFMFVSVSRLGTSAWDNLHIFVSETPLGPWLPHELNPVKNDVRSSRSAGHLFVKGDTVYRPSQDCWKGYGSGLRINAIQQLSSDKFEEKEVLSVRCNSQSRYYGVHTYNFDENFEIVDLERSRLR